MCHPLTLNGGITSLKGNSNGVLEKLLDNQLRGTSKFTVADAGGYTTDELPETIAHGAGGFQDQWGEGGLLDSSELSVLGLLLPLALPSCGKRTRGSPEGQG